MENDVQNPTSEFLAEVADFWVNDKAFRDAVNNGNESDFETRSQIFHILNEPNGGSREIIDKSIGRITNIHTKSPIRKRVLDFLKSLRGNLKYQMQKSYPIRQEYHLTEDEKDLKTLAKKHYDLGNYREAIKIFLPLLQIPRIARNIGMVGFIMNCFNKLKDYENALLYARKLLALEPGHIVALGIAALSAQRLKRWEEAFSYAEEIIKFEPENITMLGIAALSAQRLERYEKSSEYAQDILKRNPKDRRALFVAYSVCEKSGRTG